MLLKSRTGIMRCRNQPVLLIYNTHSLKQQDCLRRQDNRGKMILATLICKDHSYSFDLDLITVSQSCCSLSSFPDTAKIFKPFPSGKRFLDLSYCALWHHKREPERSVSFWSPQDSLFHKMLKYNCCANKKKKKDFNHLNTLSQTKSLPSFCNSEFHGHNQTAKWCLCIRKLQEQSLPFNHLSSTSTSLLLSLIQERCKAIVLPRAQSPAQPVILWLTHKEGWSNKIEIPQAS